MEGCTLQNRWYTVGWQKALHWVHVIHWITERTEEERGWLKCRLRRARAGENARKGPRGRNWKEGVIKLDSGRGGRETAEDKKGGGGGGGDVSRHIGNVQMLLQ